MSNNDLMISMIVLAGDNSKMLIRLPGDGMIPLSQFDSLQHLMDWFGFDRISGNCADGWELSKTEEEK